MVVFKDVKNRLLSIRGNNLTIFWVTHLKHFALGINVPNMLKEKRTNRIMFLCFFYFSNCASLNG